MNFGAHIRSFSLQNSPPGGPNTAGERGGLPAPTGAVPAAARRLQGHTGSMFPPDRVLPLCSQPPVDNTSVKGRTLCPPSMSAFHVCLPCLPSMSAFHVCLPCPPQRFGCYGRGPGTGKRVNHQVTRLRRSQEVNIRFPVPGLPCCPCSRSH
jgi:hypothetical protein